MIANIDGNYWKRELMMSIKIAWIAGNTDDFHISEIDKLVTNII